MCIRDSITAGLRWNSRETRRMLCNDVTILINAIDFKSQIAVQNQTLNFTSPHQYYKTLGLRTNKHKRNARVHTGPFTEISW